MLLQALAVRKTDFIHKIVFEKNSREEKIYREKRLPSTKGSGEGEGIRIPSYHVSVAWKHIVQQNSREEHLLSGGKTEMCTTRGCQGCR